MKINDCTLNRVRRDYAHLIITAKILGEINEVEVFLVDWKNYPIRIAEDMEFGLADDACLVEHEEDKESLCTKPACLPDDVLLVDSLVDHLQEEWSQEVKCDGQNDPDFGKVQSVKSKGMTSKTDQWLGQGPCMGV